MSFGDTSVPDPAEAKLKAEKEAENKKLMLQRVATMRRLRSGGVTTPAANQETLG